MKAFGSYVNTLEQLYLDVTSRGQHGSLPEAVSAALDGEAGRKLRQLVPLSELRESGAFFTGSKLATAAATRIVATVGPKSRILDPACGAGDLLVACAQRLPTVAGFRATLGNWAKCILGKDLEPEFVRAARLRLTLAAVAKAGLPRSTGQAEDSATFRGIQTGCGLSDTALFSQATHVILNPPFNHVIAAEGCTWTRGKVCSAAVFLDECVSRVSAGTRIVAILPDVLRSGERYRRWRESIIARTSIESVQLFGQFDRWADVDVFILELITGGVKNKLSGGWGGCKPIEGQTVGTLFDVSIGPLVPFRLSGKGSWCPYIHARNVPTWGSITTSDERKRFNGTTHTPPFVVVRRTSRMSDKQRAVATLIERGGPYAVENHLIILQPKDNRLSTCKELLSTLQSPETDAWLNQRIRCRHLTVSAVQELPMHRKSP